MKCISVVLAVLFLAIISTADAADPPRPNVIVILADDMGIDSVSGANRKLGLETSAIDQLIREGMSFSDAHSTSAVCSPTRYSLLTGRYNWRSRLKRGIVGQWERPLINAQRLTIAEMFQECGYDTACIGKWHLGWSWPKKGGGTTQKLAEIDFGAPVKGGPNDHGFDYYFGDDVPNWPPYVWRENEQLLGELASTMKAGAMVGVSAGPSVEDWDFRAVLAEYSKRWADYIRQRAETQRPFFLYVPMPSPHTPIAPHESFRGQSKVSEYADFLIQTDNAVGDILKALKETGQAENTVVIFTCDNGTSPKANFSQLDAAGVHLNENWRGWKADAFEGGHRVPFVVRWPGEIDAGTNCDQTITLADVMATCADVVQYELQANMAEDSVSLLPVMRGEKQDHQLHNLVVHHSASGQFAVRKGKWKLLYCRGSGGWSPPRENVAKELGLPAIQLYDLQNDPKETKNLHEEFPEVVDEITNEFQRMVERGRSTPGPDQPNHAGAKWWNGLPWERPKEIPFDREDFQCEGHKAFVILPPNVKEGRVPWVWYAPTLDGRYPGKEEDWMIQRFLDAGIAIAGIDVGESYGSPEGRRLFQALYAELTEERGFGDKPVLLARSRGGLMLYNWAVEHPDSVGGIAGIYPVCNLLSYPGLKQACGAYEMTEGELNSRLAEHNPIDRLAPLAKAQVPILHIHGDQDTVVPIEANSAELAKRYKELGGPVEIQVIKGQGHNMWKGWFQSPTLTDFVIERATFNQK